MPPTSASSRPWPPTRPWRSRFRLIDRLRFDAYHDALTGLPNRRRLLAALDEAVKVRANDEVVGVLVFDIDGLRDVNDSLGHDAGDTVVSEVASRLRRVAPAAALVGRAGSDEFAVTLRLPGTGEALRLAEELRGAVHDRWRSDRFRSTSTWRSA